jgi:head-tail adaptor
MNTGKFDRLVEIWTPTSTMLDGWNEPAPDPPPGFIVETWASIKTAPGTERFASAENAAAAPLQFFFRWRANLVNPLSVITYDGQQYDVKSIEELGRRQRLRVLAVARVTTELATVQAVN